jgi:Mlc titration factor MtfA (ptsG expression regulator)
MHNISSLSASDIQQASLPKRMGGLGLTSARRIRSAAALSALHMVESRTSLLQGFKSIIIPDRVLPALFEFNSLVHDRNKWKDGKAFMQFKDKIKVTQHAMTAHIHKNDFDMLVHAADKSDKTRIKGAIVHGSVIVVTPNYMEQSHNH